MNLTWQDPPASQTAQAVVYLDESLALKMQPGRWALLVSKKTPRAAWSAAYAINVGQLKAFQPAGHYQAAARGNNVYARYLGEGQLPGEDPEQEAS